MKKHAIIPIFIPHSGCNNDCVFCNQRIITARTKPILPSNVTDIIEAYLKTIRNTTVETVEVAFFGGSFTGIPLDEQTAFLNIAQKYKADGKIDKIHLSTRPDYISEEILDNLKAHNVDVIELGVQSFDQEVLKLSKRGHLVSDVYKACELIKAYGFTLGIQLMIGLPGDTMAKSIESAKKAAKLKPDLARLYPTVVLEDTELARMYKAGKYEPFTEETAVQTCKEMYKILVNSGITVMRVGLKSTDLVTNESDLGSGYHPAFRQLVEGEIAKEQIIAQITALTALNNKTSTKGKMQANKMSVSFASNPKTFSNLIGHKAVNKKFFGEKFPMLDITYISDDDIPVGKYLVIT